MSMVKVGIGVVIVLAILAWAITRFPSQEEWLPTYYPNPLDLTTYSNGPIFNTLEQCRNWVNTEAARRNQAVGDYDYECGLNCKLHDSGLFVCKDTLR